MLIEALHNEPPTYQWWIDKTNKEAAEIQVVKWKQSMKIEWCEKADGKAND